MKSIAILLTAPLLAVSAGSSQAAPTTHKSTAFHVGATALVGLAAVDVVGDASRDLVTVARSDLTIRILPGSATGGFGGPLIVPAANDARRAATGDVNGDGVPDLLVIGHDNLLSVRIGLGNRMFGPAVGYSLRNHGNHVAVADLNGDAFADAVAVHDGSGNPVFVTAFLGSATGDLHPATEIGTPYGASSGIATGDFDGDGTIDVAVAVSDNRASVLVFRGLGTGQFAAPLVVPTVSANPGASDGTIGISSGDLDHDGRDDLVIACYGITNQLVVRRGSGPGFADPVTMPLPSPVSVALGDVDGDGSLDAVTANLDHGTLSLLHGRGDGTFDDAVSVPAGPHPTALAVADLDGDGIADIAVTDISDDAIRVYLSRGSVSIPPGGIRFTLEGPDPIRDEARFRVDLPEATHVRIHVFDVTGRQEPGGIDESLPSGTNEVRWNAGGLTPGVYVARLSVGGRSESARFVHLN